MRQVRKRLNKEDIISKLVLDEESREMIKQKLMETKDIEDEKPIGDPYDLFGRALNIHSPIAELTADFTLSDLSEESIKAKPVKFVREQIKICGAITHFIKDKRESKISKEILMKDLYTTVILSRARGGKVIKALLEVVKMRTDQEEEQEEKDFFNKVKDRLLSRREEKI